MKDGTNHETEPIGKLIKDETIKQYKWFLKSRQDKSGYYKCVTCVEFLSKSSSYYCNGRGNTDEHTDICSECILKYYGDTFLEMYLLDGIETRSPP